MLTVGKYSGYRPLVEVQGNVLIRVVMLIVLVLMTVNLENRKIRLQIQSRIIFVKLEGVSFFIVFI
jgi:hypothetical protein